MCFGWKKQKQEPYLICFYYRHNLVTKWSFSLEDCNWRTLLVDLFAVLASGGKPLKI
jgi:hypothetical protein